MRTALLTLLLLAVAAPAPAQHNDHGAAQSITGGWTTLPLVTAQLTGRDGARIGTVNTAAAEVTARAPDGVAATLPLDGGKARYAPAIGNYHLVQAVDSCDAHVATASTAVYFPNPGPAPTALLQAPQADLVVLPERLPREHAAYRAGETWRFHVRFDGQPLPGARVLIETANGTKTETVSDLDGDVAVTFPEDFPANRPSGRANAAFVVAAVHQTGARQHVGAFNHVYRPGAYDGKSLGTGVGFMVAGMACAVPLLRRRAKGGRA